MASDRRRFDQRTQRPLTGGPNAGAMRRHSTRRTGDEQRDGAAVASHVTPTPVLRVREPVRSLRISNTRTQLKVAPPTHWASTWDTPTQTGAPCTQIVNHAGVSRSLNQEQPTHEGLLRRAKTSSNTQLGETIKVIPRPQPAEVLPVCSSRARSEFDEQFSSLFRKYGLHRQTTLTVCIRLKKICKYTGTAHCLVSPCPVFTILILLPTNVEVPTHKHFLSD